MSFCSFADGAAMFDSTPIENMFLMEYMYDAPAAALKVYLYARMLALHPELGGGIPDVAKALRLDEDEVFDAFGYWERRGLVVRLTDQPPTFALMSLRLPDAAASTLLDREMYQNRDFNNALQKLFENTLIEQRDFRRAADWVNILHFDKDAVVRMVEYGIETSPTMSFKNPRAPKPHSVFERMNKKAEEWAAGGARTLEDVERLIAGETGELPLAREVLKKLGIARQPTEPEIQMVKRWTGELGFDRDQILAACDDTISARNPTLKYLNSILEARLTESPEVRQAVAEVLRELDPQAGPPTPDQLRSYQALTEAGFDLETVRLAAVQCHRKRKYRFSDLEWMLSEWRKAGVRSATEAEAYVNEMRVCAARMREVFRRAGQDRRPTQGQVERDRAWRENWSDDMIDYAAECAAGASDTVAYMEKLLERWHEAGADTVEAAKAQREAWRAGGSGRPGEGAKPANPALDYAQRTYTDEDFGDDFFVDLSQYGKEDGRP